LETFGLEVLKKGVGGWEEFQDRLRTVGDSVPPNLLLMIHPAFAALIIARAIKQPRLDERGFEACSTIPGYAT
jgi:hypothetical protein